MVTEAPVGVNSHRAQKVPRPSSLYRSPGLWVNTGVAPEAAQAQAVVGGDINHCLARPLLSAPGSWS